MAKVVAILPMVLFAAGCSRNPSDRLARLSDEFIHTTLAFSPATATGVGLHRHQGQNLDNLLDDTSPANLDRQRHYYEHIREQLEALSADPLTAEDQADLNILQDQVSLALLDLNELHSHLHNPTLYVETLGNALFSPYVLEYAPLEARMRNIIARLQKAPVFLDQASANLISSPDIWTKVAMEENEGNIGLVDKTIRAAVPADLRDAYNLAALSALDAMRKFQDYLKNSLSGRDDAGWRMTSDQYMRKFRFTLESEVEADTMLQMAERELLRVRAEMLELALPLHRQLAPAHKDHAELSVADRENRVIGEVLAKIAERHSTRESYMDDARQDLAEARAFVEEKRLLTLPQRENLQVIPTPEFMRGVYSVGGFSAAPALEPQLGAFYWVTPIPADWPKERVESKLHEYNYYKLKLLTIHEAMPGHYVQMEFANNVQPESRRVLRSVDGNGPYIEGWGEYATQAMLDEGFLGRSPEMALTFAKERLRVIANAILDVRLHMLDMTDQEALDLMEKQTFQEKEEATEKLQRAKLSSCQLPMYYVGWSDWLRVREQYRQKHASSSLSGFHDWALKEGAVPLPALRRLLTP
jgi:uncharacterized protein (DUF885 family)